MTSFRLFFAGAEEPGWRKMLIEEGVENIALTYMHLRKRLPKRKAWTLAEQVPEGVQVMLDSGAYTANKDPGRMDRDGWINYDAAYLDFVEANLERIDLVTEFDSLVLGEQYIKDMREDFWNKVPAEKFLPVWHPQYGLKELDALAERYPRLAVVGEALSTDRAITTRINMLVQRHGTLVHGIAVTKPDLLRSIRFDSAASTSWLSPSRYGDTIVWDGTKLRRYPKAYKDDARRRHKMLFTRAGYDADKIINDDSTELLRFTIWSWLQLQEAVARRRPGGAPPAPVVATHEGDGVTTTAQEPDVGYEEIDPGDVGTTLPAVRNETAAAVATPRAAEDRVVIPVIGMETIRTAAKADDAAGTDSDVEVVRVNQRSVMVCDSCYMSDRCPKYSPGSECAFDIPIQIRNKPQLTAMLTGMMEMQAQRVVFARLNEQLEGGYPDPNVSNEMDRFMKMVGSVKEIQDDRDFFEFTVRTKAGAGMMSRIFGQAPAALQKATQEPSIDTNAVMAQVAGRGDEEPVDAEVVEP